MAYYNRVYRRHMCMHRLRLAEQNCDNFFSTRWYLLLSLTYSKQTLLKSLYNEICWYLPVSSKRFQIVLTDSNLKASMVLILDVQNDKYFEVDFQ